MSKHRYLFEKVGQVYEFYDSGVFQLRFQDSSFRSAFEVYASENHFSSNWIGSMLRIFRKKYPLPSPVSQRNNAERFLLRYGDEAGVKILRSNGFKIDLKTDFSMKALVQAMESRGYVVVGLLNDCYYDSEQNHKGREVLDVQESVG